MALEHFYTDSGGLASADTQACKPPLRTAVSEGVQQCDQYAGARGANGMAQGTGPTVDVHLVMANCKGLSWLTWPPRQMPR
jgi:hypothetical protein